MSEQAVDISDLVKAIKADPRRLENLCTKNPEVAGALANAYVDMVRAPKNCIAAARETLPEVPFGPFMDLRNGTLEHRCGAHSTYEFQLTLKNVQPGQTQKRLEDLVAEMNKKFPKLPNYPRHGFKVHLAENGDLPNFKEAGDVVFSCSSLINGSTNRHRTERIILDDKARSSQQDLLSKLELVWQPNDLVRALAGMFRLAKGFPAKQEDIGTKRDQGDVFEGMIARTKRGRYSSTVMSYRQSITGYGSQLIDLAHFRIGVVGGHPPKLKKSDPR
jgi:hypothetical protein